MEKKNNFEMGDPLLTGLATWWTIGKGYFNVQLSRERNVCRRQNETQQGCVLDLSFCRSCGREDK